MIKSRTMIWVGHVSCMGEMRNVCKILVGKPQGKRPQGKSRHRFYYWENKIGKKVYFLEYTGIPKVFFTPHLVGHCCIIRSKANIAQKVFQQ
jgi:hypothetical protein